MDLRDPYIADLIVGRLSWAHVAGEDRLHLDRIIERVVPYAQRYEDVRRSVIEALEDLTGAGLVEVGEPDRGDLTYAIVVADDPELCDDGGWRDQAEQVARAIVDGQQRLLDMDGRTSITEPEDDAPCVDSRALLDAVRVLDLLDRAPHR